MIDTSQNSEAPGNTSTDVRYQPFANQLRGKVALVTGAGRGIGRAIAQAYAAAGAAVSCIARSEAEVRETVQLIESAGGTALALTADVTDMTSVRRVVAETTAAFYGVDILLLNAGGTGEGKPVEACDPAAWRAAIEVNLVGAFLCAQAAIPALKARGGGKIITLGSGAGHSAEAGVSAYACSKAGLWMLTRVLAQELLADNIDVNELIPGPVKTRMLDSLAAQTRMQQGPKISQEWFKAPEDVVPLALFLATQPRGGPTGQSFGLVRRQL